MFGRGDGSDAHANDLAGRFAEFMALADHLDMLEEERRGIIGVSADLWHRVVTLRGGVRLLEGPQYLRRLGYAVPLMRRALANKGAPAIARKAAASAEAGRWGLS